MSKKTKVTDNEKDNKFIGDKSKAKSSKNKKFRGKSKDANTKETFANATNDVKWYMNNPILTRDVGSLWFSRPMGLRRELNSIRMKDNIFEDGSRAVDAGRHPSVFTAYYSILNWGGFAVKDWRLPTIPSNSEYPWLQRTNQLNLVASKIYQFVVHANSRNTSYDQKDLIMSIMAIDGLYQLIAEAIRIYGLIAQYSPENMAIDKLIKMLGWDKDATLSYGIAEFRAKINEAINLVNKFYIPDLFDILKLHYAAYQNVYLDNSSNKAQLLATVPMGYWVYEDSVGELQYTYHIPHETSPGVRSFYSYDVGFRRPDYWWSAFQYAYTSIRTSEFMGIMQGDMLRAFGTNSMMTLEFVNLDAPIYPIPDPEFLFKIHNADFPEIKSNQIWGAEAWDDSGVNDCAMIYRDSNSGDGTILAMTTIGRMRPILEPAMDMPAGVEPTPENIMLASMYKSYNQWNVNALAEPEDDPTGFSERWHAEDATDTTVYPLICGPELITHFRSFRVDAKDWNMVEESGMEYTSRVATLTLDSNDKLTINAFGNIIERFGIGSYLSEFNLHPQFVFGIHVIPKDTSELEELAFLPEGLWETTDILEISMEKINQLQQVAFWSLFSNEMVAQAYQNGRVWTS